MEYPKDPTVLPSAQRHTETYNADQGRVFTDGDVISIQIPPTSNSYLTKDVQLHFDFDMTYQEGTDENYKEIVGNLSFDNASIVINATNNTLIFTGGTLASATTYTVDPKTYAGYEDICQAFNDKYPTAPMHLYYDDGVSNKIMLLSGLLIKPGVNDTFAYTSNDIAQDSITIVPDVYTTSNSIPNYAAYAIVNYMNARLGGSGITLNYNGVTKKFYFASRYLFSVTSDSTEFMKSLGFITQTIYPLVPSDPVSPSLYYILNADTAFPSITGITTPVYTLTGGSLASSLGFTTPAALTADTTYGFQSIQGSTRSPTSPASGSFPYNFFDNLIYTEPTSNTATETMKTFPNIYRPYPTLDVNGPYGFFESLEVYDYLGNTLLEKVPRHDLLTAIWSDLESSTETQDTIIRSQYLDDDLLTITKPSCSLLVTGNPNSLYTTKPIVDLTPIYPTEENVTAATLSIPTLSCGINLYSFLGKLSEKFVPLHNGFTIKFFINRRENAIAFNTQQPGNKISYIATPENEGIEAIHCTTTMNPFIKTYTFSNVYLRGDIITVPPELDSRIDKIVFAKGYKVQTGVAQNRAQRVNTEVKSLTSLVVVQQPASTHNGSMRQSAFIRNYCPGAKLLFNKAVVSSVKNFTEAYRNFHNVFGCTWDKYVRRSNWEVDYPSSDAAWMQTRLNDKYNLAGPAATDKFFKDVIVPLGKLPRYLLGFDTRLPGYTPMAVCGIDTRKQLLEVQLETTTNTKQSAAVTMISEFDTFIEIKPSESSAVSF